jgi:hypothetical protein
MPTLRKERDKCALISHYQIGIIALPYYPPTFETTQSFRIASSVGSEW